MSKQIEDKPVLFYCKDGVLYPVAMTSEQQQIFEMSLKLISPLKVIFSEPQGKVVNLLKGDDDDV